MKTSFNNVFVKPHTRFGQWAIWLAIAFLAMFFINALIFMPTSGDAPWRRVILPFYGIAMLLCGLASGAFGFFAVVRQHERSWFVFLTLLPGAWVLFMLIGEFLFPH